MTAVPGVHVGAGVLADYFAGRLSGDQAGHTAMHVRECETCQARLAALRSSSVARAPTLSDGEGGDEVVRLEPGARVDRYVVVKVLGQGGMGVVYAAHDPELDRRVALKVLRRDAWGESRIENGRARLLREAQAMARLSHPNVVSVFDVGTHEGRLYVAMDYIDGVTLKQWLAEAPRTVADIVAVFVEAARGLAAAHAVGLIHRDFKPENVLRSRAGRVCVADFGLARSASEADAQLLDSGSRGDLVDKSTPMTQTGFILGTPAYMAPEQYDGEHADERTDQFSFCVALYEALFGEHPFGGSTFTELVTEVSAGRVRPPPTDVRVPDRLRQIVLRGLSTLPSARYPSMDALIVELAPRPRNLRRRVTVAAMVGVAALAGVVVYQARRPALMCRGAERKLAGIWDAPRRQAIHDAFIATKLAYAEGAWQGVERAFDAYAHAWVGTRTEACEATRVRGDQSEQLLDLRMACLDQQLGYARATSDLLAHPDPGVVQHAVESVDSLPHIDRCSDAKQLTAGLALPKDAATRERLDALQARVADASALFLAGRRPEALKTVTPLVGEAQAIGYPPLLADALTERGRVEVADGDNAAAAATFKAALLAAESSSGDNRVASLWNYLMRAYVEEGKFDDAEEARQHDEAFLKRLAEPAQAEAELAYTTAVLHAKSGKMEASRNDFRRALQLYEKAEGPTSRGASNAVNGLSMISSTIGDNESAIAYGKRGVELDRELLGPWHPDLVNSEGTLATALVQAGREQEGFAHYRTALEIAEHSLPPDDPALASALGNWASSQLVHEKRYAEATRAYERVLKILTKRSGPDAAVVGQTYSNIGAIELDSKKYDDAAAHFERALAIETKALGPDHYEIAMALNRLGEVALDRQQYESAIPLFQRAIVVFEKNVDPKLSLDLVEPLNRLGFTYAALQRWSEAKPLFQRALDIQAAQKIAGDDAFQNTVAESRFGLGSCVWQLGEHERGLELVKAAKAVFTKSDPDDTMREVAAFLKKAGAR